MPGSSQMRTFPTQQFHLGRKQWHEGYLCRVGWPTRHTGKAKLLNYTHIAKLLPTSPPLHEYCCSYYFPTLNGHYGYFLPTPPTPPPPHALLGRLEVALAAATPSYSSSVGGSVILGRGGGGLAQGKDFVQCTAEGNSYAHTLSHGAPANLRTL